MRKMKAWVIHQVVQDKYNYAFMFHKDSGYGFFKDVYGGIKCINRYLQNVN